MNKLKSISVSGNLLSESLLTALASEKTKHKFAIPESFRWYQDDRVLTVNQLESWIASIYGSLLDLWDENSLKFAAMSQEDLYNKWILPIFKSFGFSLTPLVEKVTSDSGIDYCLSHKGWSHENAPYIHIVSVNEELDKKSPVSKNRYSAHDTMQRYLNQSNTNLWGIVTNGKEIRFIRDFYHETRKGYISFDLHTLFETRSYEDFRLLFRLIHPSRFVSTTDKPVILEHFFEESKSAGVAVGDDLRGNVKHAIESLANGFISEDQKLLASLLDNEAKLKDFYNQVLNVIYRLLFLLYAEQRNLMPTSSSLYSMEYSITSLREMVESGIIEEDDKTDLWLGLLVAFRMVYEGVPDLGIPTFNGMLFSNDSINILKDLHCRNDKLLETIKWMTLVDKGGSLQRISYIELGVDEIGSIYEGLLEFLPRITIDALTLEGRDIASHTFFLDPRGTNRKTSGSYYTNPGLVNALIESALVPVVEDRLKEKTTIEQKEKALLSIKVCDPACGSAAFLIGATEYLGLRLAQIRLEDDYPNDDQIRNARRDVLRHCIYGVDINPMSVELAKVSLWLTAATAEHPLNFLDHRIKCGNSLVGATPELLEKGIPAEAYNPVEGDDKKIAQERKKQATLYVNKKTKEKGIKHFDSNNSKGSSVEVNPLFELTLTDSMVLKHEDFSEVFNEDTADDIEKLKQAYEDSRKEANFLRNKFLCDYWTSAFFWPHNTDNENEEYPRPDVLDSLLKESRFEIEGPLKDKVTESAKEYQFFHWHIEFPEIFIDKDSGFDCVLGNPPWERIKLQEKEFFEAMSPEVANAPNASKRKKMIEELEFTNPQVFNLFEKAKYNSEKLSLFIRLSKKFPLTAIGDINTYPIFAEHFKNLISKKGYSGIIVPTGIATDDSNKLFFADLVETKSLISLFDFENSKAIFENVHRSFKFCLLTMKGNEATQLMQFSFFNTELEQLNKPDNSFSLTKEDLLAINPNTKTCPIFRTNRDAEIVKTIYKKFPILINENTNDNPYDVSFLRMFDMSNDSNLFKTKEDLIKEGYILSGNIFEKKSEKYLPLYESKMISIYNHRFGSYEKFDFSSDSTQLPTPTTEEYQKPNYISIPRYWIKKENVVNNVNQKWLFGFRNIARATDMRTFMSAIFPISAVGNSMPIFIFNNTVQVWLLLANFSNLILDFIVRNKLGGTNMNFHYIKQFPIIPIERYSEIIQAIIKQNVLELTYTAYDLKPFAEDMGYYGEPFIWEEEQRLQLKCELDAIYAHLYEISKDDLDYILETFPIVKRKDIEKYGEYKTKRLILEKYDEYEGKV